MEIKKVFNFLSRAAFALLMAVLLLFAGAALPVKGNYKILAVLSGSMEPAIPTGSLVLVVPKSEYKTGDVVTFGDTAGGRIPTTHRIAETAARDGQIFYATKGDANNSRDFGEIRGPEILGKVVLTVPLAGYGVSVLKSSSGFLLLVILPAAWVVAGETRKIIRELKNKKQKPIN